MNTSADNRIVLEDDEVQVWVISLNCRKEEMVRLGQSLDSGEKAKAARFRFLADRHRYVVAHGALRCILGIMTHRDPAHIRFAYGEFGKPFMSDDEGDGRVSFNLSHTQNIAVVAVTRRRDIGVDVERIDPSVDFIDIAEKFFSPGEATQLVRLPRAEQVRAFYRCWTRKEAYVKANGGGLSIPLDRFDVSLQPKEPAAILTIAGDRREARKWSLFNLDVRPGIVGAVAVAGHPARLVLNRWPDGVPSTIGRPGTQVGLLEMREMGVKS